MVNGKTGPRAKPAAIDVSRPGKARRAARRAMRDTLLGKQIEGLGVDHELDMERTRAGIEARLEAIEVRLGRLERRLLGAGALAFAIFEGGRYLLDVL